MSSGRRLHLSDLSHPSFGPDVLAELGRVVGASEMRTMTEGGMVSDDELARRCAEFCAPLDPGLREECLGVIDVARLPGTPYLEVPQATEFLKDRGRGTWAVLRLDGGHHAFMADGLGGVQSLTGTTFQTRTPDGYGLTFLDAYAAVLGTPTYEMRSKVRTAILNASFDAAGDLAGRVARDVYARGKTWGRIEILGLLPDVIVEGRPAVLARATRRGVRAETMPIGVATCVRILDLPPVLPAPYAAKDGVDRTRTLDDRRMAVAKVAYAEAVREADAQPREHPVLRVRGDRIVGGVYLSRDMPGRPSLAFSIAFEPGTAEPVAQAAAPGMA
jgi:hypothetical protein